LGRFLVTIARFLVFFLLKKGEFKIRIGVVPYPLPFMLMWEPYLFDRDLELHELALAVIAHVIRYLASVVGAVTHQVLALRLRSLIRSIGVRLF
jgi:hypothetical protein